MYFYWLLKILFLWYLFFQYMDQSQTNMIRSKILSRSNQPRGSVLRCSYCTVYYILVIYKLVIFSTRTMHHALYILKVRPRRCKVAMRCNDNIKTMSKYIVEAHEAEDFFALLRTGESFFWPCWLQEKRSFHLICCIYLFLTSERS